MLVGFLILFRSKLENIHTILNTSEIETINKLIVIMPFVFLLICIRIGAINLFLIQLLYF